MSSEQTHTLAERVKETPLIFRCEGEECVGVLAQCETPALRAQVALVIVVGGPQYRVGSHRQFVRLARELAARGVPCFRFDYRGMGDSAGEARNFEHVERDICAAVDVTCQRASVNRIVLWGLCDGGSASMMYVPRDKRIVGMICVNPWVRSDAGLAKTRIKHYYTQRIMSREFWTKLLAGGISIGETAREIIRTLRIVAGKFGRSLARGDESAAHVGFLERMESGWAEFTGDALFVLSENDLTAQEFTEWVNDSGARRKLMERQTSEVRRLQGADHTFSTAHWRQWLIDTTYQWIQGRFLQS